MVKKKKKKTKITIKKQRITYIKKHPKLSANKIIKKWKGTKLSVRRKTGLNLIRRTRKIRRKSFKQRQRNIPYKYRDRVERVKIKRVPSGRYGIVTLTNKKTGRKFFIKYQNQVDADRQLMIILQRYNMKPSDFNLKYSKAYNYKAFIDKEMALLLGV